MTSVLISPAELAAMDPGSLVLIDTRAPEAFAAGHVPGAVDLHDVLTYLATSDSEGVAALTSKFADAFGAAGLDGTKTAVIYEQSMNSGFGQSCRGYFLLSYLNYLSADTPQTVDALRDLRSRVVERVDLRERQHDQEGHHHG
jgi:thiosulfate/3-mercaptopyruvate sulfurtransferase